MTADAAFEPVGSVAIAHALRPRVEAAWTAGRTLAGRVELDAGVRGYLKASPLRGRARVRHALRERLLARPAPRLCEFANLTWLREHGFGAPEPLAAGVLRRNGSVAYQFLCTAVIPDVVTLDALARVASATARGAALRALALDVARMHASGFVHRDLFARNLLVRHAPETDETGSVYFLDAWRGGARRQLRGPAYDHGCLMLDANALFTDAERELYFDTYFGERGFGTRGFGARRRAAHRARVARHVRHLDARARRERARHPAAE